LSCTRLAHPEVDKAGVDSIFGDVVASIVSTENKTSALVAYSYMALYISLQLNNVSIALGYRKPLEVVFLSVVVWRASAIISHAAVQLLATFVEGPDEHFSSRASMVRVQKASDRVNSLLTHVIWIAVHGAGIIFFFENVGVQVWGFMSSMGFLGLALSLGSQYMLQDLIGYSAIMLDASVLVGDSVYVGTGPKGNVESIGYMTTKLRTLDGELLIYRNREFVAATVKNVSRRPFRLVTLTIELAATTSANQIESARSCAEKAVEDIANAEKTQSYECPHGIKWSDYGMRFYGVHVTASCGLKGMAGYLFLSGWGQQAIRV